MLDSVIKVKKMYYPQTILGECKEEEKIRSKWKILLMMIQHQFHLMVQNENDSDNDSDNEYDN